MRGYSGSAPKFRRPIWNYSKFLSVVAFLAAFYSFLPKGFTQTGTNEIIIGSDGIMRWSADGNEVSGFGVNYTLPFAHGYRSAKRLGIDLYKAIDEDVYHFSRLGFDLFRVHVWDCEISDTLGNLLDNEHLQLFDYLLARLKAHNIRVIITPIAYWGNGWPEPDEPTPGFSSHYGKDGCLVNPAAIRAQKNYLKEFVEHVNRITGIAYKEDPSILAFEVCNEPHHRGSSEEVTAFVKGMVDAIRSTGCTKPVFYNVTHSIHRAEAYYQGGIDGGTFQWYPTGLGFQQELGGNLLPNVDHYPIPFEPVLKKYGSARIVYEFDAADMASTSMYPAMARSFRTAGMQLATHFAYDPTFYAASNTEYNTHFMNLVYTPRKALSLMICGEIFREMPMYTDYGHYPDNTRFGSFRISYEEDLAEMVTTRKFIYTHHTTTMPPDPDKLEHVAGWGRSPVVQYDGTGAYFLDKVSPGVWSLEIFPDAAITGNPFGRNSPDQRVAEISTAMHTMTIDLPFLNSNFIISSPDLSRQIEFSKRTFPIQPGAYLIIHKRVDPAEQQVVLQYVKDHEFGAFTTTALNQAVQKTIVRHQPARVCMPGVDLPVKAVVVSPEKIDSVHLWYYEGWTLHSLRMSPESYSTYTVNIPGASLHAGSAFPYYISVSAGNTVRTFPEDRLTVPGVWNFDQRTSYRTRCIDPASPLILFDASEDALRVNREWLPESKLVMGQTAATDYLYLKTEALIRKDPENPEGPEIADYSMRHYFGDLIANRQQVLQAAEQLVFFGGTDDEKPCPIQIALVMKDGSTFGTMIRLKQGMKAYPVPLSKFKKINAVLLPRPYPTFLPYYSTAGDASQLDISEVESLEISIGPGMDRNETSKEHEIRIGKVSLEN